MQPWYDGKAMALLVFPCLAWELDKRLSTSSASN